jgi:hypothetical protein
MAMIIGSALTLCGIPQPVQQGPGCEDELAEHLHESFRQSLLIKRFKHIWREGNTTS